MKYLIVGLIAGLGLLAGTAHAQEKLTPADYKHALLFQLNGLAGDTESFADIGVGGRLRLNEKLFLRGALGFLNASEENKVSQGNTSNSTEDKSSQFTMEAGLEFIIGESRRVQLYAGPILRLGMSSVEPDESPDTEGTLFAVAGVLGANWFFSEGVSVGAEYQLGYVKSELETSSGSGNFETSQTSTNSGSGVQTLGIIFSFWL